MNIQEDQIPLQLHKETIKIIRQTIQEAPSIHEALTSVKKTLEFEDVIGPVIEGSDICVHMRGTHYRWGYNKTKKIDTIDIAK